MPEGPEIKRAADRLSSALTGKPARLVEFAFANLANAAKRLTGQTVASIAPRGKALLTSFSNGETIYSHNQLYGEWQLYSRQQSQCIHASKQIRLVIHTDDHAAVLYSASDISVWQTTKIDSHPYIAKLGVELLNDATTITEVMNQINASKFHQKLLATLLLDQAFFAGLGNYLRSEILFVARLAINARIGDLNQVERNQLAAATLSLTRQSYETAGITNDIALAAKLKNQGWKFGRYRHWVFDRDGEACHVCSTTIVRVDVGGRGVYYCPQCQKP
jgi:endonuclease VIII